MLKFIINLKFASFCALRGLPPIRAIFAPIAREVNRVAIAISSWVMLMTHWVAPNHVALPHIIMITIAHYSHAGNIYEPYDYIRVYVTKGAFIYVDSVYCANLLFTRSQSTKYARNISQYPYGYEQNVYFATIKVNLVSQSLSSRDIISSYFDAKRSLANRVGTWVAKHTRHTNTHVLHTHHMYRQKPETDVENVCVKCLLIGLVEHTEKQTTHCGVAAAPTDFWVL